MKTHSISVTLLIAFLIALVSTGAGAQQMYKWIGKDGKINYTDLPPPAFAKKAEIKSVVSSDSDTSSLPYELAQAAKNNPVTLYTGADCAPCDNGRILLSKRGIPFTEKTVKTAEDGQRLKQVGGAGNLPLLVIGRSQQNGFEANAWGSALSAAGYPETSKLPASYRNPAPQSAAPKVVKETTIVKKNPDPAPLAIPDNASPSGFRF